MKTTMTMAMITAIAAVGAMAQSGAPQCATQNSTTLCRMAIGRTLQPDGTIAEPRMMLWAYSTDPTVTALNISVDYKSGEGLLEQSCSMGARDVKGCWLAIDASTVVGVSVEEMRRVRVARFGGVD